MAKSILYSILSIGVYYSFIGGLEVLIKYSNILDTLYVFDDRLVYFFDSFIYLIMISFALAFIRIYHFQTYNRSFLEVKFIVLVIASAFLLRIIEDPFWNIKILIGDTTTPSIEVKEKLSQIEFISTIVSVVVVVPIFEEILFRKIMLGFYNSKNIIIGVIISSLLFASIHSNTSFTNYISVLLSFIFGVISSIIYLRKGLFYSIIFHITYNIIWLILKENIIQYWYFINKLNFGYLYWSIIIFSLFIVLYFFNSVKSR